jgi:hypothetical protein
VVYVGDGRSREVLRAFEFPGAESNRSRPYGFEVLITTYELVLKVGGWCPLRSYHHVTAAIAASCTF